MNGKNIPGKEAMESYLKQFQSFINVKGLKNSKFNNIQNPLYSY